MGRTTTIKGAAEVVIAEQDDRPQASAVAKTWDGETIAMGALAKADDELRYTLNVVYPADKADIGIALDGHRDFASKDVVRKAAWNYLRTYRNVGLCHTPEQAASVGAELLQKGAAEVVTSYIHEGPDWETPTGALVKAGDWLAGFVWTPEAWDLIKAGKIGGVSVEGKAKRRKPTAAAVANLRN
jgi:hypothetical protein